MVVDLDDLVTHVHPVQQQGQLLVIGDLAARVVDGGAVQVSLVKTFLQRDVVAQCGDAAHDGAVAHGNQDAAVLAEVLADNDQNDPGEAGLLQTYSRWRKNDQRGTIATSDGMTRLFSHPSSFAAGLRTTAIMAHALLPSLRRYSAIKAMGYRGRVPRLALGETLKPV